MSELAGLLLLVNEDNRWTDSRFLVLPIKEIIID